MESKNEAQIEVEVTETQAELTEAELEEAAGGVFDTVVAKVAAINVQQANIVAGGGAAAQTNTAVVINS